MIRVSSCCHCSTNEWRSDMLDTAYRIPMFWLCSWAETGAMRATASPDDAWLRRVFLPNYQVQEAARYARISPQTVINWQKGAAGPTLASREHRAALSYVQLIEV